MIITVSPTIMDGTVVRWYHDRTPLDALHAHQPAVSASRNGVLVHGYLDAIGDDVLGAAKDVQQLLARNRYADVQHLATHRQRGMFGPYEPIPVAQESAG